MVSAPPRTAARAKKAKDPHPSGDERFALIDTALKRSRFAQDHLIEVLHVAQEVFGYLSEDMLLYVSRALRLPPSRVYGVATFYHRFTFDPPGDHTCTVCTGTACYVKGADDIVTALQTEYGVAAGATTPDGRFTLSTARCLGACGLAPVAVLDGQVRGHLDVPGTLGEVAANLAADATDDAADATDGATPERNEPVEVR